MARLRRKLQAVIDERTSDICRAANGQVRGLDEKFDTIIGRFDNPPFHPHCRTIVVVTGRRNWIAGLAGFLIDGLFRKLRNTFRRQ